MFNPLSRSPLFEEADPNNHAPGGGDPNPPAGDPAPGDPAPVAPQSITLDQLTQLLKAQQTSLQAEFTKQLNGLDAKYQKQLKREPAPAVAPTGTKTAEQLLEDFKRDSDERIALLEKANEEKERAALLKETDAEIKSALSEFQWQADNKGNSEGKEVAFTFYKHQAARNDDGQLVIGNTPLATYIKEHAARAFKAYHQPRNVGGAGAGSGKPGASASPLDKLNKPNLTREETKEVQNYLAQTLRELQLG